MKHCAANQLMELELAVASGQFKEMVYVLHVYQEQTC